MNSIDELIESTRADGGDLLAEEVLHARVGVVGDTDGTQPALHPIPGDIGRRRAARWALHRYVAIHSALDERVGLEIDHRRKRHRVVHHEVELLRIARFPHAEVKPCEENHIGEMTCYEK